MSRPRGRAEQKAATRARLLEIGRRLFVEQGYDHTSIALVCRRARVTHGALYHHFPGKLELFVAVLEAVWRDMASEIFRRVEALTAWARLEAACDAYLELCAEPAVRALVLRDGPRVVPLEQFEALDRAINEPLVVSLLGSAIEEGVLRPFSIELFAPMLGAAFAAAGAALARAEDACRVRSELRELLLLWLGALRPAC
jgi:AcrR family transcriptional regulator